MDTNALKVADLPQELRELVLEELNKKATDLDSQSRVRLHYHGDESFLLPPVNGQRRGIFPKQSLIVEDWPSVRKLPAVAKRLVSGVLVAEAVQ